MLYLVFTDEGRFLVKAIDKEHVLSALADFLGYNQNAEGEILFNEIHDLSQYQTTTWKDNQVARLQG